jgi:transcriptional regulator with XRE-family HTH domain
MREMSRSVPKPDLKAVASPPSVLAEQLKKLRVQRGWTQAEVASQVGVERTLIGNYEQGLNYPAVPTLQKLARLFGVTVDHLLNGEEKPVEGFQDRELLEFCLHADKLDYSSRSALKRVIEGLLARENGEHPVPKRKTAA